MNGSLFCSLLPLLVAIFVGASGFDASCSGVPPSDSVADPSSGTLGEQASSPNYTCTIGMYREACGLGNVGYLQWAKQNCELRPDQECVDAAVGGGHGAVLDFIEEEFMMEIKPSQRAVNKAAGNGMVGFLADRCPGWGLFSGRKEVSLDAKNKLWRVFKWLKMRKLYPNQDGANLAARNGHLAVLEWLATLEPAERVYPTQDGANGAARNGHLEVLMWMVARGLRIDDGSCIDWANGQTRVLQWLRQKV